MTSTEDGQEMKPTEGMIYKKLRILLLPSGRNDDDDDDENNSRRTEDGEGDGTTSTSEPVENVNIPYEGERKLAAWVLLSRMDDDELSRVWEEFHTVLVPFAMKLLSQPPSMPVPFSSTDSSDPITDHTDGEVTNNADYITYGLYIRLISQVTSRLQPRMYPPSIGKAILKGWKECKKMANNDGTHKGNKTPEIDDYSLATVSKTTTPISSSSQQKLFLPLHIDVCSNLGNCLEYLTTELPHGRAVDTSLPNKEVNLLISDILVTVWNMYIHSMTLKASATATPTTASDQHGRNNEEEQNYMMQRKQEWEESDGSVEVREWNMMKQTLQSILQVQAPASSSPGNGNQRTEGSAMGTFGDDSDDEMDVDDSENDENGNDSPKVKNGKLLFNQDDDNNKIHDDVDNESYYYTIDVWHEHVLMIFQTYGFQFASEQLAASILGWIVCWWGTKETNMTSHSNDDDNKKDDGENNDDVRESNDVIVIPYFARMAWQEWMMVWIQTQLDVSFISHRENSGYHHQNQNVPNNSTTIRKLPLQEYFLRAVVNNNLGHVDNRRYPYQRKFLVSQQLNHWLLAHVISPLPDTSSPTSSPDYRINNESNTKTGDNIIQMKRKSIQERDDEKNGNSSKKMTRITAATTNTRKKMMMQQQQRQGQRQQPGRHRRRRPIPQPSTLRVLAWQTIAKLVESCSWNWMLRESTSTTGTTVPQQQQQHRVTSKLGRGTNICTWARLASGEWRIRLQQILYHIEYTHNNNNSPLTTSKAATTSSSTSTSSPPSSREQQRQRQHSMNNHYNWMRATALPIGQACVRILIRVVKYIVEEAESDGSLQLTNTTGNTNGNSINAVGKNKITLSMDALLHLRLSLEQALWTAVEYLNLTLGGGQKDDNTSTTSTTSSTTTTKNTTTTTTTTAAAAANSAIDEFQSLDVSRHMRALNNQIHHPLTKGHSLAPVAVRLLGTLLMEIDIWNLLERGYDNDIDDEHHHHDHHSSTSETTNTSGTVDDSSSAHIIIQCIERVMGSQISDFSLLPGIAHILSAAESDELKQKQISSLVTGPLIDFLVNYWQRDPISLNNTVSWACSCTELLADNPNLIIITSGRKKKRRLALSVVEWIQNLLLELHRRQGHATTTMMTDIPKLQTYLSLAVGCYMSLSDQPMNGPPKDHESRVIYRALEICGMSNNVPMGGNGNTSSNTSTDGGGRSTTTS